MQGSKRLTLPVKTVYQVCPKQHCQWRLQSCISGFPLQMQRQSTSPKSVTTFKTDRRTVAQLLVPAAHVPIRILRILFLAAEVAVILLVVLGLIQIL